MANYTMAELVKDSIRIAPNMVVVYPQLSAETIIDAQEQSTKFNGRFAMNNSTLAFVQDNKLYVTPFTRNALETLRANLFREDFFYVPFSNGDYPKYERDRWNNLREMAHRSYVNDFVSDCESYCDKHHIGTLNTETLRNCFEMPATGVKVKHLYYEDCYYPVINSTCFDCIAADRIGRFCTNNGKVVFVYRNGKTYVAKGYKIVNELRAAGYVESGLFVPFSNGEQIQNEALKARWEAITK